MGVKKTSNLNLNKPDSKERKWDKYLNENFDIIDKQTKIIQESQLNIQDKMNKADDNLQTQINLMSVGPGVELDPRVSQALIDSEGEVHKTLRAKGDKWEGRVKKIESDVDKAAYSAPVSTYDNIISFDENTTNGQVSVGVKGITYTNLLGVAGDFEVDSDSDGVADGFVTLLASEKSLVPSFDGGKAQRLVGSGSEALAPRIAYRLPNKSNLKLGKYFVSIYVKCPNLTDVTSLSMYVRDLIGGGRILSNRVEIPVAKLSTASFVRIGAVLEVTSLPINQADFKIAFNKTKANTVSEMQIDKMQIVYLNDLGETETDVDKLLQKYPYITNTKSTISAMRAKSVGKNLIEGLEKGTFTGDGNTADSDNKIRTTNFIKLTKGNKYICERFDDNVSITYFFYELDKTFIKYSGWGNAKKWFSQNEFDKFNRDILCKIVFNNTDDINAKIIFQRIKDTNDIIEYKPYIKNNAYVIAKDKDNKIVNLRSLPNGIKDEIRISGGKAELVKRVSEKYTIKPSDITKLTTVGTNNDQVTFTLPSNCISFTDSNAKISLVDSYSHTEIANYDNPAYRGYYHGYGDGTRKELVFLVAKGTYTTLADAQKDKSLGGLAGNTLTYQLAEPEIIPIEVSGNLISYPNGTVYIENVEKEVVPYKGKAETQLPIKPNGVESVHLIDGMNKTLIDLSKVSRSTTPTNIRLLKHRFLNPTTDNYIYNVNRNALKSVTYVDENNISVEAISGQTAGDNIIKLKKGTDITAESGTNEVQKIDLGGGNAGTFTLTLSVDGVTDTTEGISANTDINVTAQNIRAALSKLNNLDTGAVINAVADTDSKTVNITFTGGNIGDKEIPLMELTVDETFNGVEPKITEVAKGYGTTNTYIRKADHGLSSGDYIKNTRSNAIRRVSVVDKDTLKVEAVSGQTTGDTIEVYKNLGSQIAAIDSELVIEGAKDGDIYEIITHYPDELSTSGEFIYSYPQNTAGVIDSHGNTIKANTSKLSEHDSILMGLALKIVDLELEKGGVL